MSDRLALAMPVLTCPRCQRRYRVEVAGRYACTNCGSELPAQGQPTGDHPAPALAPAAPAAAAQAKAPPPAGLPPVAAKAPRSRPAAKPAPVPEDPETLRLEALIASDASARAPYLLLAQHHIDRGRKEDAVATYRRCLAWAPDDAFIKKRIALLEGKPAPGTATDPDAPAPAHQIVPPPDTSRIVEARLFTGRVLLATGAGAALLMVALALWLFRGTLFPLQEPVVRFPRNGHLPLWSPGGRWLAYYLWKESGSLLCVHDFENGRDLELAYSPERDWKVGSYAWSPDGLELAYQIPFDDGGRQRPAVFRVPVTGGEPRRVAWGTDPGYSHDGRFLVMACGPDVMAWQHDLGSQSAVCAIDLAAGGRRNLSELGGRRPAPDPKHARVAFEVLVLPKGGDRSMEAFEHMNDPPPAPGAPVEIEDAAKGPDGRFKWREAYDIWLVDLDGSNRVAVTTDGRSAHPGWTPDGERLLYMQHIGVDPHPELWWMSDTGNDRRRLVPKEGAFITTPREVALRPVSNEVVYRLLLQEVDAGLVGIVIGNLVTADLFVLAPDGTRPRRILNDQTFKARFALSPDGQRVAYEWIDKDNQNTEIWVTRVPAR